LTKCQRVTKLFQPSTLKRHQRRLISTSGLCEATLHVEHSQYQRETKCGNKSPLVAFESARLEQLGDVLKYCQGLSLSFYGAASFPIDIGNVGRVGSPRGNRTRKYVVASQKPEVEISRR